MIDKIPLGSLVYCELYDIKTEMSVDKDVLDKKINLAHCGAMGILRKRTDIQISLSAFFNLDEDETDEDFAHIPIGIIYYLKVLKE